MKNKFFISVIVSTHKRPELLSRCLKSILNQRTDYEIILCADEGTVETKTIASLYLRESDSFVVVPDRKGPAATRNIGVSLARGEWICFLDDDDTFDTEYFENISKILLGNKCEINYFNFTNIIDSYNLESISSNRINLENNSLGNLWICNFIPNNALMIPANVAKQTRIDEELQSHEDWDYLLALNNKCKFKYHPLYGPNVHKLSDQSRNQEAINTKSYLLDFISIYRKWPIENKAVKLNRQKFLEQRGLSLPLEFL